MLKAITYPMILMPSDVQPERYHRVIRSWKSMRTCAILHPLHLEHETAQ